MRHLLVVFLLLVGVCSAAAADMRAIPQSARASAEIWRYNRHSEVLPFTRTERSQSVYASGACWSDCQSFCTWNEAVCHEVDAQGRCLKVTDRCDRTCQRACRTRGGPLLSLDLPWD